jgi:tetratricopeptide (TPR) repeat protein
MTPSLIRIPAAIVAAALLQTPAAAFPAARATYRALIQQFATSPSAAVERTLAAPYDEIACAVRDAAREDSGWTAEALDRVLLQGDTAIALAHDRHRESMRQMELAAELAVAAARLPGNEWFVHRWYRAVTARADAKALELPWHQQTWYRAAAGVDRARELETEAGRALVSPGREAYDLRAFKQAIPLLEQGVAAHLPVAALHLGRIQMLRGNDSEARRHFDTAANDQTSRVTRYLAKLFLGAMDERQSDAEGAAACYREAVASLPDAQSGRLALASLLAHSGHTDEARRALANAGSSKTHDPWSTYFFSSREEASILAELHAEVCR